MIVNNKEIDTRALIRKAFKSVKEETIRKCIAKSLNLISAVN